MLADPTDTDAAKKALVRTYNPPGYADPWDCIADYERVQRATSEHPDKGSAALSTVVDLPRGRIRPWLDGAQPDCYRGLQTALDRGWILLGWSSDEARALNRLAAWVLASGSISDTWAAYFVVDDTDTEAELAALFETFALRIRHTDRVDKAAEYTPREDASILGRVLHTWTGVKGDKAALETRFPAYLQYAPVGIVRGFLTDYVRLRGTVRTDRDGAIQIQAHRSDAFRRDLVAALERVVDPDDVRGESWPVYLVGDAVDQLSETTFKNR